MNTHVIEAQIIVSTKIPDIFQILNTSRPLNSSDQLFLLALYCSIFYLDVLTTFIENLLSFL